MAAKPNCWEVKQCGRQIGGSRAYEMGVCPVATETRLDQAHDGQNAGRCCWVVAGSLCNGTIQGSFAQKYRECKDCDFYQQVQSEEGGNFTLSAMLLNKLQ